MKNNLKIFLGIAILMTVLNACVKKDFILGDLTAPTNIVITTVVKGQNTTNPNGDGSGDVDITITADNAISYKVDYDANTPVDLVYLPTGFVTKKYTTLGTNTYKITAVVYGRGGTSSSVTKDVTVKSDFTPAASIVTNLTAGSSKSWVVDKTIPAHFGVGPWSPTSTSPEWWAASVNEKVACCNCFYTATFTFAKISASNTYTLAVTSADGAFTKTGSLTSLPGIPSSGGEGCYGYGGGSSNFSFIPASSGFSATVSTQTSILLSGTSTYIGYGSVLKEYEILQITPTSMYLRVQGTETGNAWYLKLKSL